MMTRPSWTPLSAAERELLALLWADPAARALARRVVVVVLSVAVGMMLGGAIGVLL